MALHRLAQPIPNCSPMSLKSTHVQLGITSETPQRRPHLALHRLGQPIPNCSLVSLGSTEVQLWITSETPEETPPGPPPIGSADPQLLAHVS